MIKVGDRAWHKEVGEVLISHEGDSHYGYTLVGTGQSFACLKEDITEMETRFKIGDIVFNTEFDEAVTIVNVSESKYFFNRHTLDSPGGRTVAWFCPHAELEALPVESTNLDEQLEETEEEALVDLAKTSHESATEMLDELSDEDAADVAEQAFGKTLVYADDAYKGLADTSPTEEEMDRFANTAAVFKDVDAERARQDKKWGSAQKRGAEPGMVWIMTAVLGEEFGESCQALLWLLAQKDTEQKVTDKQDPRYELTQVAATAVAMIEMGDAHGWWK